MRITTQMLNASARKAGLPLHRNSLLDYINNSGDNSNPLLQSLQNKSMTAANQINSANRVQYKRQERAADDLYTQIRKFTAEGEKSLFEKAKSSEDRTELAKEAESLAEKYNSLLKSMSKNPDRLSAFYQQSLREIAADNKKDLAQIGISVAKDGTMSVDKEKFSAASLEDIEKVLGGDSSFIKKVTVMSEKIGDNAAANLSSASDNYLASGKTANRYTNSKYDFWG